MSTELLSKVDELISARGSASPAELGIEPKQALELCKKRPDLEPVFLVRFKSRQGTVRAEEVRAYAWPAQQLALSHLGYRAEEARLKRLEPRAAVPFPKSLYARFAAEPKQLEALRQAEKGWDKAIKQAPSKPGRCEMDLNAIQPAMQKLGADVAVAMWIEAAATFQRIDNPTYAAKMLGNLLKLIQKEKGADASLLARTLLGAAEDGVWNAKLYEFVQDLVTKKVGAQAALAIGLRVLRRLLDAGRAVPSDFVKDLRKAAERAKARDFFESELDGQVVWAAGIASFWNTARKSADWRSEETKDHAETGILRARLGELWRRSHEHGEAGEPWRAELWGRICSVMPELSAYGRNILVEWLLEHGPEGAGTEAERLFQATLALLARSPRESDRTRLETAAQNAFARLARTAPEMLWDKRPALEDALRAASGNLSQFVRVHDLLADASDLLAPRDGHTVLSSLAGLTAAWAAALTADLLHTDPLPKEETAGAKKSDDDDDDDDDDDEGSRDLPFVALAGEALALLDAKSAGEALAEMGPLLANRLARELDEGSAGGGWEPVLGTLRALGAVGEGVCRASAVRFVKRAGAGPDFGNARALAQLLDADVLREAAASKKAVDEVLKLAAGEVAPAATKRELKRPEKELSTDRLKLVDCAWAPDGSALVLWAPAPENEYDDLEMKKVVVMRYGTKGHEVAWEGDLKGASKAVLWLEADGPPRVVALKERNLTLQGGSVKPAKATLGEDFEYVWRLAMTAGTAGLLVATSGTGLLLDAALKPIKELDGGSHDPWFLLEAPGHEPMVLNGDYDGVRVMTGRGNETAKIADLQRGHIAFRTDDGTLWVDYTSKKKGNPERRARYDVAQNTWTSSEGKVLPERPVVAWSSLQGRWSDDAMPAVLNHGGKAFVAEAGGPVRDFAGNDLAALSPEMAKAQLIDLASGMALGEDGLCEDPSLPARIAAAAELLAARSDQPEGALERKLYGDRAALAAHVMARVATRPSGKEALAKLGPHAKALFEAAVEKHGPTLAGRLAVLERLEAPPRTPRPVPRHKEGVSRTEVRRAVRAEWRPPLDALVMWALDGADPAPLAAYLVPPEGPRAEAWEQAARLLRLAQDAKTTPALAERALAAAEAIAAGLEAPGLRVEIDAEREEIEEHFFEYRDADDLRKLASLDARASLLWIPYGVYPKKDTPVPWDADPEARRTALEAWVKETVAKPLGGTLTATPGEDGVKRWKIAVASGEDRFDLGFCAWPREKEGLSWALPGVSGKASLEGWERFLAQLDGVLAGLRLADGVAPSIQPGVRLVRKEMRAALRRGIELTRARLSDRDSLRPVTWKVDDGFAGLDAKQGRLVMLAWLFGDVDTDDLGVTRPTLQALEKVTKTVGSSWRGIFPARGGNAATFSAEYQLFRAGAVVSQGGGRYRESKVDKTIVLRDPAEVIEAIAKEIGPVGKAKAEKPAKGKKA